MNILKNKVILITGGTGSFGKVFTETILKEYSPAKLIIYSRDELKQYEMEKHFSKYDNIRFFIGDVRDKERLLRAFAGVDYVIHAAALKHVPAMEYNPTEAVKTNVTGADCIINAAIDSGVKKVVALSTDKAVNPINLYGATKLVSEKLFVAANAYGGCKVKFSVVRYGNVVGSRGSVIPFFLSLKEKGVKEFPITDKRMTRFWITLEEGVSMVLKALNESVGGEVFVPVIPSMKIVDLARAIEPKCTFKFTGIRAGEKIHETMISEDEARNTKRFNGSYVIMPQFFESDRVHKKYDKCESVAEGFVYRSDKNDSWITPEQIRGMISPKDGRIQK